MAATNPVSIDGSTVTLTLAEPVAGSLVPVTVGYTAPAANPLRDADNAKNPVTGFTGETVTNNTSGDTTPPSFVSATANGRTVTVTFDEALAESVTPAVNAFQRNVAGSGAFSTGVSISGRTATATFATAARHGQAVTVVYNVPSDAARRLKDLSGNDAPADQHHKPATNVTPPAFSSASVNGAALTVTFDGGLDPGSEPAADAFTVKATRAGTERDVDLAATGAVSISGSAVTLTLAEAVLRIDTVTVAYAAPARRRQASATRTTSSCRCRTSPTPRPRPTTPRRTRRRHAFVSASIERDDDDASPSTRRWTRARDAV